MTRVTRRERRAVGQALVCEIWQRVGILCYFLIFREHELNNGTAGLSLLLQLLTH